MRLPRRISDILKQKEEFLDAQRAKLETSVMKAQLKLFSDIIADIIPDLDVKDSVIQDTANNYRLISTLDKTYKSFQLITNQVFLNEVIITTGKIVKLNADYFKVALVDIPARFEGILSKTEKLMNLRVGLDGGKLVRGGYLQSFFDNNSIGLDLKQMTAKAMSSNMDKKDYIKLLKDKITGTAEYKGGLDRQFQRYAYDLYSHYDAAYNMILGNEFGFSYFIYQGGLVKDSREFCKEHNGKVYSQEDAQEWINWKSPTTGEKPSYMNYPGYDPLIDLGGYNCRHLLGWISDELAFRMRPDLKEY